MAPRVLITVLAGILVAACAGGPTAPADDEGWRRLPDPPLSPRTGAVLVGVGEELLVVGGWVFLCPPNADCVSPPDPLFADGAVYDRASDSWRTITPAPFGVMAASTAAMGDTAYLVTGCESGPPCDAQPRLLAYDLGEDLWTDHGPVPGPPTHGRSVDVVGEDLLVHNTAEGLGEVPDLLFDPELATWTELPNDPLTGDDYDRFFVHVGDHLVLAGSSVTGPDATGPPAKSAARFDLTRQEWFRLPDAPGSGYQLLPTDRGPLLNGHYGRSPGWILDPDTWTWSELPALPGNHRDIDGVLDRDSGNYGLGHGPGGALVYDSAADAYVTVPPPPGRDGAYDESGGMLGRDLVVFGGQRWRSASEGHLLDDAWLWTAPTD